jgi:hypothetical protein
MEFPCIADEAVLMRLKMLAQDLIDAPSKLEAQDAVFAMESLVSIECVIGDFVAPSYIRGVEGFDRPPGNLPAWTNWTPFEGLQDGGILDTIENPCCCKLLADLEYIFNNLDLGNP